MTKKIIIVLSFIIVVGGLGYLYQTVPMQKDIRMVQMINNEGEQVGIVKLSETKAGMLLALNVSGLTPNGEHAFHIHETSDCSSLKTFKSAGDHFKPENPPEKHSTWKMPTLLPNDKGVIRAQILNRAVTLNPEDSEDGRKTIFDHDNSALVIHAQADDHMDHHSSGAGDRIACGEIK